jgi:hypothetical protein
MQQPVVENGEQDVILQNCTQNQVQTDRREGKNYYQILTQP